MLPVQFQRFTKRAAGFVVPLVYGESFFGLPFGVLPHQVPITTVVGRPIGVPKYEGEPYGASCQPVVFQVPQAPNLHASRAVFYVM